MDDAAHGIRGPPSPACGGALGGGNRRTASLFFREASNRGVREQNLGAGTSRECFVTASASKRSPAGNADGALVGRDVISIDEPRRGNCHETSVIC